MKKIIISIAVLAVLGAAAYLFLGRGEKPPEFRTEKVKRGGIEAAVTASGTVNAVTTVLVGTQVSGTIKKIHVDFNSPVVKGQVIAEIDPATFEAQVEQARANLLAARANLEKSRAALIDAERTFKRNGQLYSRGLIARSELDTAETAYEAAKAQVSASDAQVAQAGAALKFAETNLRYTRIVSPVDGTVVSRNVDAGQTVAASFQTPTLFTIAQDLTKMQVNTSVAEADIGAIKPGLPASFTVDAYPDIEFKGDVSEVRNAPVIIQNVVTYDVIVKVGNPDLKLKPGMTANASITVAERAGVLMAPNAALRFRMPEVKTAEKGPGVWVLRNGKTERVSVGTGISDGMNTELVSGGLTEGQEVIVEAVTKNSNGSRQRPGPRMFF
ncbi:MAG: efflux RND transporter periplasmic adaptor subunit [Deltaproteobacteria bacterium]|nr:efflux RND transporter periplasmic adaptor subunit [Deltaproteobacteria bacterium]